MGNCCSCTRRPSSTPSRPRVVLTQAKTESVSEYDMVIPDSDYGTGTVEESYSYPIVVLYERPSLYYDEAIDELIGPEIECYDSTSEMPGRDQPLWVPSTPYSSASFVVTSKANTIEWKGYGLKIHVLDDSIPLHLTEARLNVSVHGLKNRDSLPLAASDLSSKDNHAHPASALYSIKVGSGKLCKPVTIEIQHCLSSMHMPHSMILRAASGKKCFIPIKDAVFNLRTNYGRVTVPKSKFNENEEYDDFSWFIIALRRLLLPNTIHYKAQVYISKETLKMHFIITMAIDPCTTVVETKYETTYDLETSFSVEFDDDSKRISLDVPELKNGWVITPLFNPSITKRQVDRFCIFHNDIPKCEFSMHWSKESPPARLMHRIDLKEGTANNEKHFFISFNPPPISSSSSDHHHSALECTSADTRTSAISGSEQAKGHLDMIMTQQGQQLDEHYVGRFLQDIPKEDLVKLGMELGLNYSKLDRLKSTDNFCTKVVSAWLREEDNVGKRSDKPSWESLAKALEEIGQNGIGRTVREEYCC